MNKKVSVIVPVYNVEKYLETCIISILNQSYTDLEVIIVDDGSKDNSGKICDELAKNDKRIIVIHQENQGLSGARNSGIDIATGDYLFFVDSDDFLELGIIEHLLKLSEDYNADLVSCDSIRCDEEAKEITIDKQKEILHEFENVNKMKSFLTEPYIKVVAWGKLYKKELFTNIRFPLGKYHEDNFTTYKVVDRSSRIVTTSRVGYIYRNNQKSITNEKFSVKRLDELFGKVEQLQFINQHYPALQSFAEASVVYACNLMVFQMGKCGYSDLRIKKKIQEYYRKYEKSYLASNASRKGKVFSIVAFLSFDLAYTMAKYI